MALLCPVVQSGSEEGFNYLCPRPVRSDSRECPCDDAALLLHLRLIRSASEECFDDANRIFRGRAWRWENWEDSPMAGRDFDVADAFGENCWMRVGEQRVGRGSCWQFLYCLLARWVRLICFGYRWCR